MGKSKKKLESIAPKFDVPRIQSPSKNDAKPVFCFAYLTKNYTISDLEKESKIAFINRLEKLAQQTWQALHDAGKERGTESLPISALDKKLNLPPDVTEVVILRFRNGRIIGFREQQILHITAIDPTLTCYKH